MHLAVFLHKTETGVILKMVLFRVFQNEPSPRCQEVVLKYQFRKGFYIREIIGRVGEDNIERVGEGMTKKRKYISLKSFHLPEVKLAQGVPYKAYVPVVYLYKGDVGRAA